MTASNRWPTRSVCAMRLNGEYLEDVVPGYRTLKVDGRHDLKASIDKYELADGGTAYVRQRVESKTISVSFAVLASSAAGLHDALDKLNGLLDYHGRADEAMVVFDDDPDYYYSAARADATVEWSVPTAAKGTISLFLASPYKARISPELFSEDSPGIFKATYAGYIPCFPKITITATGDLGGIMLSLKNRGGTAVIKAGDLVQSDGSEVEKPEEVNTENFVLRALSATGWAQSAESHEQDNLSLSGGMVSGTDAGLTAGSYGTGDGWHGPAAAIESAAGIDAIEWSQLLEPSNPETCGRAIVTGYCDDGGDYKVAVRITVEKRYKSYETRVYLKCMGNLVDTMVIGDARDSTMVNGDGFFRIVLSQDTVSFSTPAGNRSCSAASLRGKAIKKVDAVVAAFGQRPAPTQGIMTARLVRNVSEWQDEPNLFRSGDVITINPAAAEILVNDVPRPDLGDIMNDWDAFRVRRGVNDIRATVNAWARDPTVEITYHEVRL